MVADNHRFLPVTILAAFIAIGSFYAIGYHFYVAPAKDKKNELEEEIRIQDQALRSLESGASGANLPEGAGALQSKLPIDKEMDQILVTLEAIAESTGVTLKELVEIQESEESAEGQGESEAMAEIDSFAYELQGKSEQYEEVDNFLQLLEKENRLLRVNHLEMAGEENGVAFTVHIQGFYAPDLEALLEESIGEAEPTTEEEI